MRPQRIIKLCAVMKVQAAPAAARVEAMVGPAGAVDRVGQAAAEAQDRVEAGLAERGPSGR
jgi:hypothetical protein